MKVPILTGGYGNKDVHKNDIWSLLTSTFSNAQEGTQSTSYIAWYRGKVQMKLRMRIIKMPACSILYLPRCIFIFDIKICIKKSQKRWRIYVQQKKSIIDFPIGRQKNWRPIFA